MDAEKKQRVAARRARIEGSGRLEATEDGAAFHSTATVGKGDAQAAESRAALDAAKSRGIDRVTAIRVEADRAENTRRIDEEERRQDRLWRLQEEAQASGKANAAIEMRWMDLQSIHMPQELQRELEAQMQACAKIIASKDALISEFKVELKAKDEEYVKALQQEREEIEELLKRMTEQYKELRNSYEIELEHIEDAFLSEREELLAMNKSEIDGLFDKRRGMEMKFVEERLAREAAYQAEVDGMQAKDAEDYNKLKIRLETDIQILQQQLQHMQATYLLNTEKLEYNYRVLTEKDGENRTTQIQQKRKLARLKEAQANVIARYHEAEKRHKQKNTDLTAEYRRITKQYKDLQVKYRHFQAADQRKFREVWGMHEETVGAMMKRLLDADRVIHEQLLGWEWEPPTGDLLTGIPTAGDTSGKLDTARSEAAAAPEAAPAPAAKADGLTAVIEARKAQERGERVRVMLRLIAAEAKFLVPEALEEEIAKAGLPEVEASVSRVDAILKAIGVENEDDIGTLLGYFFEDDHDSAADDEGKADVDGDEPVSASALAIKPEDVVAAVRKFVDDRAATKKEAASAAVVVAEAGAGAGSAPPTTATKDSLAKTDKAPPVSIKEEAEYWRRLRDVIPPRTVRVWHALEKGMSSYSKLLTERGDLVKEVDALRRQNEELNNVLSQYLSAKVNDELIVPPTQTIRIDG